MISKIILLVEGNPSDIRPTKRAPAKSHVTGTLAVADDGQEALDYLFGASAHADQDVARCPCSCG